MEIEINISSRNGLKDLAQFERHTYANNLGIYS